MKVIQVSLVKVGLLVLIMLAGADLAIAKNSSAVEPQSNQVVSGDLENKDVESEENPGGTEDDSIAHIETLPHKSGYTNKPNFGSAASIPLQLEEDDRIKSPIIRFPAIDRGLKPWFDRKKELNELIGFQIGLDYNTAYQSTNDSLTDDDKFMSGTFRVYGKWTLYNKDEANKGSLVFQLNHRHSLHYPAPNELPANTRYIGVTATNFSDAGTLLGDVYWQQYLGGGNGGFIVGRFDPNDFMDVLGYANPYTTFSNLAVLLNESIALPDWSWGVGVGSWLTKQVYLTGSLNDANGTATNEKFFDGGAEFFSQAEIGWSPEKDQRYYKNVHLTIWHVDERKDLGIESSKGIAVAGNWTWNETWMAFARAGWSQGSAPISNEAYTIGFGRMIRQWSDVFGIGFNWGKPPDKSLPWQKTTEVFYRLQFSQNLQLTPSLQYIKNPALNDETSSVWLFGLRMRLTL